MARNIAFLKIGILTAALITSGFASAQTVQVITGQGSSDASGVPATTARMIGVSTNVKAPDGTIYFTEQSGRVRKITPQGLVYTIAGRDFFDCGFAGDNGPAIASRLCYPSGIALDTNGNLYIGDAGNNSIRKISPAGLITTYAGSGPYGGGFSGDGGAAALAEMDWPSWMTFAPNGDLYFTDEGNNRVRKITPAGIISTVAGSGPTGWSGGGFSGDGGPATAAMFCIPQGLGFDSAGNLYVADAFNHRVRKVTSSGTISTVAGSTAAYCSSSGGFSGDGGPALSAELSQPQGLATDMAGSLYIADHRNKRVRKIDAAGIITTVAGNGTSTSAPVEGALATSTPVPPWSVSVDATGDVYADTTVQRLVKIDMPTICLAGSDTAECEVVVVEEGIVQALDAGDISPAVAKMLLSSLAPIQTNLAWIEANPSSPDLARVTGQTCTQINSFNVLLDKLMRDRRLPKALRDAWKADMLEVKAEIGCKW